MSLWEQVRQLRKAVVMFNRLLADRDETIRELRESLYEVRRELYAERFER